MMDNGEPIGDGAAIAYTERKDGVLPGMDIRTDRWEHMIEARDILTKQHIGNREMAHGERSYDTMTPEQQKAFNEKYPQNRFANKGNQGT